ncbi:pyridoxal phosphate-dependent transferase [Cladochytrium replicatum]|nr:pyridoxal phosphate-dependent transferase [Cladochytrium replicatum]
MNGTVRDFSSFLSIEASLRAPSNLKSFLPYMSKPGTVSLAGGLPQAATFAIDNFSFRYKNHTDSTDSGSLGTIDIPMVSEDPAQPALREALQYGNGFGYSLYVSFIRKWFERYNSMKYDDWGIMATGGNTSAFDHVLRLLINPGDGIFVEEHSFPSALEQMKPVRANLIPVKMDSEGMIPEEIERAHNAFRLSHPDAVAKLIYVVPTGQNPTGASMSIRRRKDVLSVAKKLDLLIAEDDPYSALQLPDYIDPAENTTGIDAYPGVVNDLPNIVSFDDEGRVLYMFTFSKVIAPGIRCGFTVANKQFMEKLYLVQESSLQAPSGLSQAAIVKLLTQWGDQGYHRHLQFLQKAYTEKRNIIVRSLRQEIGKIKANGGKPPAEFHVPNSGMFIYIKVHLPIKSTLQNGHARSVMEQILERLLEERVLLVPGYMFAPAFDPVDPLSKDAYPYFRCAFSTAPEDMLARGAGVFIRVLSEFGCGQ